MNYNKKNEEKSRYPFKYTGEMTVESFFSFLEKNTTLKYSPMSQERIEGIERGIPENRKIPQQYRTFLECAGSYCEMLNGTDYNIVSADNEFKDFRAFFDEEELACFQKYGFALEDCLFFFSHQENTYGFFRLDEGDNPNVHLLDINAVGEEKECTFSEFIIGWYNDTVDLICKRYSSWSEVGSVFGKEIMEEVQKECHYDMETGMLELPYPYDIYDIVIQDKEVDDRKSFKILHSALEQSLGSWPNIYAYTNNNVYLYIPGYDEECEYPTNIYAGPVFFVSRDDDPKWGWFTLNKKVYVFGDKFGRLIEESALDLGLKKQI